MTKLVLSAQGIFKAGLHLFFILTEVLKSQLLVSDTCVTMSLLGNRVIIDVIKLISRL